MLYQSIKIFLDYGCLKFSKDDSKTFLDLFRGFGVLATIRIPENFAHAAILSIRSEEMAKTPAEINNLLMSTFPNYRSAYVITDIGSVSMYCTHNCSEEDMVSMSKAINTAYYPLR